MPRTTPELVLTLVTVAGTASEQETAITPFIEVASAIIDGRIAVCAGLGELDPVVLELIERQLAAHSWVTSPQGANQNRVLKTDNVGDGVGRTWVAAMPNKSSGLGLRSTSYGNLALQLDTSGCLAAMEQETQAPLRKAKLHYLGTPPEEERIDYNDYSY